MRALAIAATGMSAQEQNLEVIANNIANINTTGFKRSRAEFTDLMYQTERLMGVSNRGRDATIPEGRADWPRRADGGDPQRQHPGSADQHRQHARSRHQRPRLVSGDDGQRRHRLYARRRLQHQPERAARHDGWIHRDALDPDSRQRDESLRSARPALVTVTLPGQATPQQLGQLTIANFVNEAGLQAARQQLFPADGRLPASPPSASRATRPLASFSKATSKPRTSTR